MTGILLEICVDNLAGLEAAIAGGADRVELCSALALGGLSPSPGLVIAARKAGIPAMVMVRPRAGGFVWSDAEIRVMLDEIITYRDLGATGVVIGASLPDGRLDLDCIARLVAAAAGLELTLHRAIDLAPDPSEAVLQAQRLGIKRILTSGGASRAIDGAARLQDMQKAGPAITIMPGAGVTAERVAALHAAFRFREVHASCSVPAEIDEVLSAFGFQPSDMRRTDHDKVKALRDQLDCLAIEQ